MEADWDRNNLLALTKAEKPEWDKIVQRASTKWEEAFLTDPLTKMNAVHYIVLRRRTCPDFETVISTVRKILDQNNDAATGCDAEKGFTPLGLVCDTAPDNYNSTDESLVEQFLQQDADLVKALHEENDTAMDIASKRGLSPLAIHVEALSRLMRQRKFSKKEQEDCAIDVLVSPLLEVLLENSGLDDCSKALNTLYVCNTNDIMNHYMEEEDRARNGEMSQGLETGWWLLDLMVQILFAAHNQLYVGQTITNFSPLQTMSAIRDCPIPLLMVALRSSTEDLRKAEKVSGNLPIHNVASWELPYGDPITRKSIALTTLMRLYPAADTVRNKNGETPTDIYYRKTNTIST